MQKADFHIHTNADPHDQFITYDPYTLIDTLAKKGITVASLTHHLKLVWDEQWKTYAGKKGILLLPGVELCIEKADVLVINAKTDKIKSFGELKKYKKTHPESLIIAPHPFAHIVAAVRTRIFELPNVFDAIELSTGIPFANICNKKAKKAADKLNLPLIANTDSHLHSQIGSAYTIIQGESWEEILKEIRKGKTTPHLNMNAIKKYSYVFPKFFYQANAFKTKQRLKKDTSRLKKW